MRPITFAVVLLLVLLVLGVYLSWTDGRLARLATRVQGSWSALDAQLVRRSAAAGELAAYCRRHSLGDLELAEVMEDAAVAAQAAGQGEREYAENELSKAIRAALLTLDPPGAGKSKPDRLRAELATSATRVGLARQIYNDAVRDLRGLRRRRIAGLLVRRGRHVSPGDYFEIDDTALSITAAEGMPGR
ncbi:MAG TPA: LemA family protein [Mycobacteriales bacterium]|nr:LemA family protein [Mycobacteriales bacterium]